MSKELVASQATILLDAQPKLRQLVKDSSLFKKMKERKTVTVDNQVFYIVEGDTLLDEDQLALYAAQREKADEAFALARVSSKAGLGTERLTTGPVQPNLAVGLVGMTAGGKVVRWEPGKVLDYRIVRDTFLNGDRYELARTCMEAACQAWEQTCGIRFQHRADLDAAPGVGTEGALFAVREFDAGGDFIAAAFFPTDPPSRRKVLIDPSFFDPNLSYDRKGVLRHELGHVLGFRHEHIRSGAPAICPDEDLDGTFNLTDYDPQSVMHYFCGGNGSHTLSITSLDKIGAQQVYGPPLDSVQFIA